MTTPVSRVKFLVEYAYNDLDKLREGDWLNLWPDLTMFLIDGRRPQDAEWGENFSAGQVWVDIDGIQIPRNKAARRKLLRAIQRELVALFDFIVAEVSPDEVRYPVKDSTMVVKLLPGSIRGRDVSWPSLRFRPVRVPGTRDSLGFTASGKVRDLVLWKATQDLLRFPSRPLNRCPGCGRVFYRVRKQTYCTRVCFKQHYDAKRPPQAKNQKRARDRAAAKRRRLAAAKAKRRRP
jgi:hypothetical protein